MVEKGSGIMLSAVVVVVEKVIWKMYKLADFQQINRLSALKMQDSKGISDTTVAAKAEEEEDVDEEEVNISSLRSDLLVRIYTSDSVKEIYPCMIVPYAVVFMAYDTVDESTDLENVISNTSVDFPAKK